jgi:hypothetical protein
VVKENDEEGWGNSTMIYCKNVCKCHNVPQYNNNNILLMHISCAMCGVSLDIFIHVYNVL